MAGEESSQCMEVPSEDENPPYYTTDYTYSYDKYSCIREFYFAHLAFSYLIFASGVMAMLIHLLPRRFQVYHSWCGRVYLLAVLWSTCTSLLMNNTGLSLAMLASFATTMIGLTVGWITILVHKSKRESTARAVVETRLMDKLSSSKKVKKTETEDSWRQDDDDKKESNRVDLHAMMTLAQWEIQDSKTWVQRFFSLKALHGILLFASWFPIALQVIFTPINGDYQCVTYPVYKPVESRDNEDGTAHFVPMEDPSYDQKPWADGVVVWLLSTTVASICFAIVAGLIISVCSAKRARQRLEKDKFSCDTTRSTMTFGDFDLPKFPATFYAKP